MADQTIRILHLYPESMNIYGDWGNVLTIKRRLEWRGYETEIIEYNQGDELPDNVDIVIGGGGQDSGQDAVYQDLLSIGDQLKKLAEDGTPMLVICGLYQLFGHRFMTASGKDMPGIGIFDAETIASDQRMIGNTVAESPDFGVLVGFENHSGKTTIGDSGEALATIRLGAGNNGADGTEGAKYKNVIGSYLHGSLLPKNPQLADWLIKHALVNKFGPLDLAPLDDELEHQARHTAQKLAR